MERHGGDAYAGIDKNGVPIEPGEGEFETPTVVDFIGTTLTLTSDNLFGADMTDDHVSIRGADGTAEAQSPSNRQHPPPVSWTCNSRPLIHSEEYNRVFHPYSRNENEPLTIRCVIV